MAHRTPPATSWRVSVHCSGCVVTLPPFPSPPPQLKRQNQAALVIQQHYRLYRQSLAQHQREGVKRAAQVMEDFMRWDRGRGRGMEGRGWTRGV